MQFRNNAQVIWVSLNPAPAGQEFTKDGASLVIVNLTATAMYTGDEGTSSMESSASGSTNTASVLRFHNTEPVKAPYAIGLSPHQTPTF